MAKPFRRFAVLPGLALAVALVGGLITFVGVTPAGATAETTTTSLNTLTSPIYYGSETSETFTGTVTGQSGDGYPEGTVAVYYGSGPPTSLCSGALTGGSGDTELLLLAHRDPAPRGHLFERRCRVHARYPDGVGGPDLHLRHLDVRGTVLHGEHPRAGDNNNIAQHGHLADHVRIGDLRDLHRHRDRRKRRRLSPGVRDGLLRQRSDLALQQRAHRKFELLLELFLLAHRIPAPRDHLHECRCRVLAQ